MVFFLFSSTRNLQISILGGRRKGRPVAGADDDVWVEFLDYFKSSFCVLENVKIIKSGSASLKVYREII